MARPTPNTPAKPREGASGRIVPWTVLAVVVSVALSMEWLSPLVLCVPVAVLIYAGKRKLDYPTLRYAVLRWAATILVGFLVTSAFLPERVCESVPLGNATLNAVENWFDGGPAAWNLGWVATAVVVFSAAAYLSGGALAFPVLAALSSNAAVSAAAIYSVGRNIFEATLIALSPWQWAVLAGCWILTTPLAKYAPAPLRWHAPAGDPAAVKRDLAIGLGLFALALLLRIGAAGVYGDLVRAWSVV